MPNRFKNVVCNAICSVKGLYNLTSEGVPLITATKFVLETYKHNIKEAFISPHVTKILFKKYEEYGNLIKPLEEMRKFEEEMIFDPRKKSHVVLIDSIDSEVEDRGKLLTLDPDNKMRHASEEEILEANVFAIGGIDFDNRKFLSSLLNAVNKLKNLTPDPNPLWYCKPLALHPYVSKQERYEAAVKYNLDKGYYHNYAKEFVDSVILPRLIDPHTGVVKPPERDITFFSYSVGGRDIMMFENALKVSLLKNKVSKEEIFNIFAKIKSISIGFAVDIESLDVGLQFTKIIVFNEGDAAVLIPEKTYNLISADRSLCDTQPLTFIFEGKGKCSYDQFFVVFSQLDCFFPVETDRHKGHGLFSYIEAIEKDDVLTEVVCVGLHSSID
jgi:hypothetical protein